VTAIADQQRQSDDRRIADTGIGIAPEDMALYLHAIPQPPATAAAQRRIEGNRSSVLSISKIADRSIMAARSRC